MNMYGLCCLAVLDLLAGLHKALVATYICLLTNQCFAQCRLPKFDA